MPAIQDTYSIDVRNRYDLGGDDSGNDSEEVENVDPLEQLKKLEEEKEREREQKRQLKLQQAAAKKREQRRKEKEAAARKESAQRKEPEAPRPEKPAGRPETGNNRGPRRERPAQGDRPAPGNDRGNDERLPPRRRNEFNRRDQQRPRVEGGEGGDRFGERKYDRPAQPYNDRRPPQGGMDGEGRPERFDRPDRPERFRGSRGGYRGGGGGYRGGRGGGRNDGRDDRGKREFERRSGSDRTSVRPTEKREGGGPRNWGSPTEDTESTEVALPAHEDIGNWADHIDNETQQPAEPRSEPPAEGEGEEKGVDEGIAEPEPEEVELTLDEWRAQQEVQRKQEFNIRQPGEGEDMAKWRNCELLHQSTLIAQKNDEQNAQHGHSESHRRQMMKQHLDVIDVRFTNEQKMGGRGGSRGGGRGGGPRGGRGGGRGRGGPRSDERGFRGAPRGGRYEDRANQPPDVLNEKEFPTLPAA